MNYTQPPLGWTVSEEDFQPGHTGKCESIFAQGNGYLNLRCALEESYITTCRGAFVTGTFNKAVPEEVTELPNLPDMTALEIKIDGQRFSMDQGTLQHYRRTLDLKTGQVCRSVEWISPRGVAVRFLFRRFVSLDNEHLAAFSLEITPQAAVEVMVESGISTRVSNSGSQHCSEGEMRMLPDGTLRLVTATTQSAIPIAAHCFHRFDPAPRETLPVIRRRHLAGHYTFSLAAGATLRMEKFALYHTGRDLSFTQYGQIGGTTDPQQVSQAGDLACKAVSALGYDQLLEASARRWADYWQSRDVEIDSPEPLDQLGMRFALYHLNIMIERNDDRVGIGAKGMTGEGYKGHSFWDTEMFLLPHYLLTDPAAARTLLRYRWRSLPGAFKKAAENGYQGAMFPWESAWLDDGEVTPLFGGADVLTGRSIPILTGMIEHHITADVAWGVWLYYRATGDDDFMEQCGFELLVETGRFWRSRLQWQEDARRYEIRDVIGPDEYKEHVDNNAFTNYLAAFSLSQAASSIRQARERWPMAWQRLSEKYDLEDLSREMTEAREGLYLPQPRADGLVPQNRQYLDLEPIDLTRYRAQSGVSSIVEDYSPTQMNHLMISKQADLVMLLRIMPDLFDAETRRKNFLFYESRTLHDSSLSHGQHCVIAAWEGLSDMALTFYRHAAAIDLGPNMTSSDDGIHSASMGNIWQCVVCGFAGLQWHQAGLSLQNHLPKSWNKVSFSIFWQGARLQVTLTPGEICVQHLEGPGISLTLEGVSHTLAPGQCIKEGTP